MAVERFAKHGAVALVENTAATFREHADADEAYVRGRVEGLAAQAAAGAGSDPTRLQLVRSACHALFVDAAGACIRGNEEDYYNPSNSFLSAVLRRSLGIPITMCTLLAAVCSRLGVTLRPVSFPMTFHLLLEPDRRLRVGSRRSSSPPQHARGWENVVWTAWTASERGVRSGWYLVRGVEFFVRGVSQICTCCGFFCTWRREF